jgi:hypothetical protein
MALFAVGLLVHAAGSIMFLVAAFRTSVPWGVAVLFIPPAGIVFLFKHWAEAKKAFLLMVLGVLVGAAAVQFGVLMGVRGAAIGLESLDMEDLAAQFEATVSKPGGLTSAVAGKASKNAESERKENMYVGLTLDEVKELLGEPMGTLRAGRRVTYFYDDPRLELAADDGVRISYQGVPAE